MSTECPMEAVLGPDDRWPCILPRGHEGPHKYTPESTTETDWPDRGAAENAL